MKKLLTMAAFLVFAGAAQAQYGGTINDYQGYNTSASGLESAGSLNPHFGSPSSSEPVAQPSGNVSGQNPGEFVPSTFASYKEVVADAKANANKKPLTLADIARQAQVEKKAAEPKQAVVLEEGSDGKLVIANPKKN
jgi:hypothetical protein